MNCKKALANPRIQPTAPPLASLAPALRLMRIPFAGHRPLPRLVGRKEAPCANIVLPNPAAGAFGAGSRRGLVPARGRRRVGRRTIVAADPAVRGRWPGCVPKEPWPSATGPPGAAELHPFAGHRPLPRLVGRKEAPCAKIVLPNPAAGELGAGRRRDLSLGFWP